jgi:hypothetical protein
MTTTTIENIEIMEAECTKLYKESTGVWTQLKEDMKLQEIGQNMQVAQNNMQNFKEVMITLPLAEMMAGMEENRKFYLEMNRMRA